MATESDTQARPDAEPAEAVKPKWRVLKLRALLIAVCVLSSLVGLFFALRAPVLTMILRHGDEAEQLWSASKLGNLGKEGVPGLIEGLRLEDQSDGLKLRMGCCLALIRIGEPSIPFLIEAFKDDDMMLRNSVLAMLLDIGGNSEEYSAETIGVFIAALKDPEHWVRGFGARALGKVGKDAMTAIPALTETLRDEKISVVEAATRAINRIRWVTKLSEDQDGTINEIIKALIDTDPTVRELSADMLGDMGKDAEAAIPALTKTLEDEDESVVWYAERALKEIREDIEEAND